MVGAGAGWKAKHPNLSKPIASCRFIFCFTNLDFSETRQVWCRIPRLNTFTFWVVFGPVMVHDFLAPCPPDFVPSTLANLQRPSITLSKHPSAVTIFSPCFVFRKVIDLKFMHGRTCVATFNLSIKDILREHLLQFSLEKMYSFQQPND